MPILLELDPGTRFIVPELGLSGVLVKANDCRAVVRLDKAQTEVEFIDKDGEHRKFKTGASRETSWTPYVNVQIID